jgi:gas vesicle protein
MGQDPSQIREEIEQTRSEMGDTVDALAHKTDVKGRVKESFSDKKERLRDQMMGTRSKIGEATPDSGQVKDGARQAAGMAQENPIGLALGGLAAGFLAGMLLPSTRVEDEKMGAMADQVKEKAAEAGHEAVERGKDVAGQVAEQTMETAKETAKEAGSEQAEEMKASSQDRADQVRSSVTS